MSLNNIHKRQRINEDASLAYDMSSYGCYINSDSNLARTSRKRRAPNASKNGKSIKTNKSIFKVAKGCSGKRRKHILNFEQISVLENYFHIDPDWKMATVDAAATQLGLPVKKIYKWGYDRKHVSRSLGEIKPTNSDDFNGLVDEILMLKSKEADMTKKTYPKREKAANKSSFTEKNSSGNQKQNNLEQNLTSIEDFSDFKFNDIEKTLSADLNTTSPKAEQRQQVTSTYSKELTEGFISDTYKDSFWPTEDFFGQKICDADISTQNVFSLDHLQFENIWSPLL
ncbi:unnamed protein product [Moneuplotes crassus]|uniref:Homeobox domain-containing protein n=1 Tax=Euplotes crassus TaxID=5936 RepID=A0AAD1UBB0_EUPCR|nr:unnamed protein product [Moneuplotes crassus]